MGDDKIPENKVPLDDMVSSTFYTEEKVSIEEKSTSVKTGGFENTAFTGDRGSSSSKDDLSEKLIVQRKKKFRISYEVVFWFFFIISMILCILDRFFGNGDITLGRSSKIVNRMWGVRVGETILNIIWGFTARLMTVTENTMLWTMLWIIPNVLVEYAPSWLDVSNIRDVHVRIHRITGIYLIAIPTLIHVNSIFIPPLIDKTNLTLYHIPFNRHNWSLIWDPAAIPGWSFNDQYGVHLTNDEVFRYANNMVLFLVIFPLTRSNYLNSRSYSFAIGLHVFAGIWHILDNVRKISHGLNHWYNVPMMFIWGIDRFLAIYFYRKSSATVASRKVIGKHEYVELRLKTSKHYESGFGDIYYFLPDKRGVNGRLNPERAHPFTSYANHSADRSWDIGLIINVMDDKTQWHPAWTRVACNYDAWDADPVKLRAWGPYRSSVWELHNQLNSDKPCLLIASGSGYGYLMDALGYLAHTKSNQENQVIPKVDIHYSVRCHAFLKHYRKEIDFLLDKIESNKTADVRFNWYCTKEQDQEYSMEEKRPRTRINEINRRINFDKLFSNAAKYTTLYFVGNPSLTKYIEATCEKYNLPFIRDYTNGTFPKSDKKTMMRYLSYLIKYLFSAVTFLFLLSIYVKSE